MLSLAVIKRVSVFYIRKQFYSSKARLKYMNEEVKNEDSSVLTKSQTPQKTSAWVGDGHDGENCAGTVIVIMRRI